MRCFVGIPLSTEIRDALASSVERHRHRVGGVRWVEAENLHVTLKFLGDLAEAGVARLSNELAVVASRTSPFSLDIGTPTAFPDPRRPRVVVIGCGGEVAALQRLAAEIETRATVAGAAPEHRAFRAHITIGRVKESRKTAGLPTFLGAVGEVGRRSMAVEIFNLYESILRPEGAVYRVIRSFRLGFPN